MMEPNLTKFSRAIEDTEPMKMSGKVTQVIGLVIESKGPNVSLGELCYIKSRFPNVEPIPAEVVGFREGLVLLMPIGEMQGIGPGCEVLSAQKTLQVKVGMELLGRVLDGLGNPMDGKGPILSKTEYPLHAEPPDPLQRPRIKDSLYVGVRAIDGLITLGSGQRIGIMAGSGVGKSTLLSMIARNTEADISVISLVGERGREVRDFIERDLGEEGLKRSVVVVATSDKPALVRIKGAMTATAIAEYFRDQGRRVVLMMDSVTRFAMAQREVGLTIGEPPATRGYTPSVFALLPRLLERAGTSARGSITGIYTVLVDGDDMNEPIADAVRSTESFPRHRHTGQRQPCHDRRGDEGTPGSGAAHAGADGRLQRSRGFDPYRRLRQGLQQADRRGHRENRRHQRLPLSGGFRRHQLRGYEEDVGKYIKNEE